MTDPRRLLDGSEASPALRALLASAKRDDDPGAPQIEALSARIAAAVAPIVPIAPAPPVIATAAASAGHAAIAVKAGAVIVALGVIGGGGWYVRQIRDDARTHVETRPAIKLDARQVPAPVAPRAPDHASDHGSDHASVENVVPRPSPTPSPDSASAPPRPTASPRQPRGSGDSEAETKLVVAAGAALVRDDAEAALALTREHLAQFPNGAHAEERDRIAIEALARLGGLDDARAAADRFFLRYPRSIYRSRIESLLR
jgi:hypothetical protein